MFYGLSKLSFDELNIADPIAMELGVCTGNNAQHIYEALNPRIIYLIDTWNAEVITKSYYPFDPPPPWVDSLDNELYKRYYGGDLKKQETWEVLYKRVEDIFRGKKAKIIRQDSLNAHYELKKKLNGEKINFLYIDGNHQFEYVYYDLVMYSKFADENAIIQLNDCCFSIKGARQNLGVLEACTKFIKSTDWRPVAINLRDFSDIIMVNKKSHMYHIVNRIIEESTFPFIEVPDELLAASKIQVNKNNVISMSFI